MVYCERKMMANVEKCQAVMDHIRMNPELHNQRYWGTKTECGTAFCFAGLTCVLNGHTNFEWRSGDVYGVSAAKSYAELVIVDQVKMHVRMLAASLLDLDWHESHVLFGTQNTVDDLELMVKNLANGDPIDRHVEVRCEINVEPF
jgi:hypothetical protein